MPFDDLLRLSGVLFDLEAREMNVLIDTNIFIARETAGEVPEPLQELEKLLRTQGQDILVHPLSKSEIQNYENEDGRRKAESKIATYVDLKYPQYPDSTDTDFRDYVPKASEANDRVDNSLLFAVYSNQVDILISEDRGIHEKAELLDIEESVLTIERGREFFREEKSEVSGPPSIQKVQVHELNYDDPIFDSLREAYSDFDDWIEGIPDRDAYVSMDTDGKIGAILILKPNEDQAIGDDPELPKKPRLKICTLKVAAHRRGSKAGELLISIALREAIRNGLDEAYLTHYIEPDDDLVELIARYGFTYSSDKANDESIFVKRLTPGPEDNPDPFETCVRFYPSFYDGDRVSKYLVPIRPEWHNRLFTAYEGRQSQISEFWGFGSSEGNSIKKAYLCHANIRSIEQGDLLLFYRSHDRQEITSLGVCERIEYGLEKAKAIQNFVGRVSVFTDAEIEEMAEKPTTAIRFTWHFDLTDPIHYKVLLDEGVLKAGPQSIQELDEPDYKYIRDAGGIDERFTVN